MSAPGPARARKNLDLQFASLPSRFPANSLFGSFLLHTATIMAIVWLHALLPAEVQLVEVPRPEVPFFLDEKPLTYGNLPSLSSGSPGAQSSSPSSPSSRSNSAGIHAPRSSSSSAAKSAPPKLPKAVYAGPQQIVSDLKDATNTVQTVRRPDLLTPPKLKFPVRLESQVVIPAFTPPVLAPKPTPQNAATKPQPAVTAEAIKPQPILPVTVPQPHAVRSPVEPPKVQMSAAKPATLAELMNRETPLLAAQPAPPKKAVIVVNAIEVPPDPKVQIPDAEVSGSFAVIPARPLPALAASGASGTGTADANGTGKSAGTQAGSGQQEGTADKDSGAGEAKKAGTGTGTTAGSPGAGNQPGNTGAHPGTGTGTGTGIKTSGGNGNGPGSNNRNGNGTGTGRGNIPGNGAGARPGTGSGPGAGTGGGITISGGIGNGSTGHGVAPRNPQRGYGMTIISGGSSGGASRDLGVFGRSETVYTVYISMADTGGGPDWPMQYSLAGSSNFGSGLVTPPFAQTKVRATIPISAPYASTASAEPVFVSGIIDEKGVMQGARAIRQADAKAQAAVDSLHQWRFSPAMVNGNAVATKVLIGVTVLAVPDEATAH